MDFKSEVNDRVEFIEKILKKYLVDDDNNLRQSTVVKAMNYSVMAGGKRLRPMLVLETSRLFGGNDSVCEPFMAAVEMIHTYSLVHDDLPAMDNDEFRRGRKTTWVEFGEDMGILAGDALLNYAYETGLKGALLCENPVVGIKALKVLADKAGLFGMVGGQIVDVEATNKQIDISVLEYIHELKTGALIEASMMMGAILAGADEKQVDVVEKIASNIGHAFQIQDDILDVTSTTEELGKNVLSDEKNNKTTYVTLLGIEDAKKKVQELTNEAITLLESIGRQNEFLKELLISLVTRKK